MRPWYLLLLPILLLAACGRTDDPVSRGQAAFYGFGCVRCHTVGHTGGVYGPDLTTVGFRKSAEWLDLWLKDPHAWRAATVMPHFNLNDAIRGDLVAYLSVQRGQAWGQARPWDAAELQSDKVRKGGVIFQKAGCVACHGLNGAGGYPNNNFVGGLIPALTKVVETYSRDELKQRITHGRKSDPADPSAPPPMIFMPPWKEVLKEADIEAVGDYVLTLHEKAEKAAGGSEW